MAAPAALAAHLAGATWTVQWLRRALQLETGSASIFISDNEFRALTGALASDGSLCTPPAGIPAGQAGSPQAGQPGVALWSGFTYSSSQSTVADKVLYMLQPFVAALTASGMSCALRRRDTGVQYMGGGAITRQASELYVGLPPHTFAACRQLWHYPNKDLPTNFAATPLDIAFHQASTHTIAFAMLGDGTGWRGSHEIIFCFPTFSLAANQRFCDLLGGGAGAAPFADPTGPHGPFRACPNPVAGPNFNCPAICPTSYRPLGGPRVAPGARRGEGGAYAVAACRDFMEMMRISEIPAGAAFTLSGVPYPARLNPISIFDDGTYPTRHRMPPAYNLPAGIDVRASSKGPYQGAQIVAAFFHGFSGSEFLDSLTWGGNALSRQYGLHGLNQRANGWRGTDHFDRAAILPHPLSRQWDAAADRRTANARQSQEACRDLLYYLYDKHLTTPAGAVLAGLPFVYVHPAGSVARCGEINGAFVPACNAQRYIVQFDLTKLPAQTAIIVTAMGRGV